MTTHDRHVPKYRLLRLEVLADGYVAFHFDGATEVYDPESAREAMRQIIEFAAPRSNQ